MILFFAMKWSGNFLAGHKWNSNKNRLYTQLKIDFGFKLWNKFWYLVSINRKKNQSLISFLYAIKCHWYFNGMI